MGRSIFVLQYFMDVASFIVAAYLSLNLFNDEVSIRFIPEIRFFLFALLILQINYSHYNLYRDKRNLFDENELMKVLYSHLISYLIVIFFVLLFGLFSVMQDIYIMTVAFILSVTITCIVRFLVSQVKLVARKHGYDRKKVVFYGLCLGLSEKVKESTHLGYDIIARTNTINNLKKHLGQADIVFLTKQVDDELIDLMTEHDDIEWKIISSASNLIMEPVSFDEFKDFPIINIAGRMKSTYLLKRPVDFILSLLALIVLSPLLLLIALLIKITMPGPVFFKHRRLGKNLIPFDMYKFRSMVVDADKLKVDLTANNEVKGLFKIKEDPRITSLGKILRRTNLDELPQLINILMGDMSIVGPRPHLKKELKYFKGWRRARFNVKPGLTGLWQVNGRHELNFDKAVLYDIYYVKHMSLNLDMSIILKTIPSILMSRGKH